MIPVKHKIESINNRLRRSYGKFQIIRNGFWYIDIPRTSSSSIKVELSKEFGRTYGKSGLFDKSYNYGFIFKSHIPAREMKSYLGEKTWSKLFTFTIVRNPWDRIVSLYHYLLREKKIPPELSFHDYVLKLDYEIRNKKWEYNYPPFYWGSSDFVTDEKGNIIVSEIGKYENRKEDIKIIAEKIGSQNLGNLFLQKAAPQNKHYSRYYNDETKNIIFHLYHDDIRLFKYEFETH